jgi:YD repeat-containing protein
MTDYAYDLANRMTSASGVSYTWDDNGNLLDDGTNTYSYDHANRLVGATKQGSSISYGYNGLGDRLSQTMNSTTTHFTMDLNTGLTQVLANKKFAQPARKLPSLSRASPQ